MGRIAGRGLIAAAAALALVGCTTLPRSGPLSSDIDPDPADGAALDGLVAPLTAEAAALASRDDARGFPEAFLSAAPIDPERLGPGDLLEITIWEGEGGALLTGGAGPARLSEVAVAGDGRIYVPFVGTVPAAGATLGRLRARVADSLSGLTVTPQVDVRLAGPRSRMLTVQGAVARPGVYAIDAAANRLAPMLALAGGATLPPEQAEVTVRRGDLVGSATVEALFADPAFDIALRPGDRIVVNAIRSRFVALGASTTQAEIPFPTRRLSLLRAIGAARGLDDFNADPTGVFVFRREEPRIADALLPGPPPPGLPAGEGRPIVYRLDLTRPESLFVARAFEMRDGDAIFVTNAPLTELRKVLTLFSTVLAPVQQGAALSGN